MDKSEGIKILKQLADGIDPYSGEGFPEDSPYQHPQTIRALFYAVTVLESMTEKDLRRGKDLTNAGKPWGRTEDAQLITDFDSSMSIEDLAHKHQRTIRAIEAGLSRLGKITLKPWPGIR
jgi:hypothetical protein